MKPFTILSVLALALPFASATPRRRHHQEVANRVRSDIDTAVVAHDFEKRTIYAPARFTYYDVGLGACGITNQPDDLIVALNVEQFGDNYPGDYCFKTITISYGGQTSNATIVDKCMGCPYGGLDFSRGLFSSFAPESVGVLYGQWWLND